MPKEAYPIKTLEPNTQGKDYVIGDLHGSYSVFENLLDGINFKPDVDRIISVGDLVDRGPDSLKCMGLLREKWFHSVLANHEAMLLTAVNDPGNSSMWLTNGGHWGMEFLGDYYNKKWGSEKRIIQDDANEFIDLIELIEELPYLITVTNKSGKKFHIIHAELPRVDNITDAVLEDPVQVSRLARSYTREGGAFLWSRMIFGSFYEANLQNVKKIKRTVKNWNMQWPFNPELSHVISGHTVLQNPMTIWGQTCIDTCAHESYVRAVPGGYGGRYMPSGWEGLTCVELDSWRFYKATPNDFKEIQPLVITESEIID